MRLNNKRLFRFMSVLGVMAACGAGIAGAEIRSGSLVVHPYAGLTFSYDSNIYLTKDDVTGSLITMLTPGVSLSLPVRNNEFKFNYFAEVIGYKENPSGNNAVHHNADFSGELKSPTGLSFGLKDSFRHTTDPATSDFPERVPRNYNALTATVGYQLSDRVSASLSYTDRFNIYLPGRYDRDLSRREGDASLEGRYGISPKTSVLLGLGMGTVDYIAAGNPKDSRYTEVFAGIRGQLTPKTTGEVRVGSRNRTYNNEALSGSDDTTGVAGLSTVTRFSPRADLTLGVNRNLVESTFIGNPHYTATLLSFRYNQKVLSHWTGMLTATYEDDRYPNAVLSGSSLKKRGDTNILAGVGASYSLYEWLSFSGAYTLRTRDSNFNAYDYTDGIFSLNTKVMF